MTDRGPLDEYEVLWRNGGRDVVRAHQVTSEGGGFLEPSKPRRVYFHGEIDGHWRLLLSAMEDDILTIRNVTHVREEP